MINIIPKPYSLLDNEKRYLIDGFKYNCPTDLEDGLNLFKQENFNGAFNNFVIKEYKEDVIEQLKIDIENHDNNNGNKE